MKGEIDKDFFCSINMFDGGKTYKWCDLSNEPCKLFTSNKCEYCHRKHPTPEQFEEEYGEEWTGAVYIKCVVPTCTEKCNNYWNVYPHRLIAIAEMCDTGLNADPIIVCACTPFGKPDDKWRPE